MPRDRPELRAKRNPARYRLVMVGAGVIGRVGAGGLVLLVEWVLGLVLLVERVLGESIFYI